MELIREFIYPTEYDPPQLSEQSLEHGAVFPVTPSTPTRFETRNIGFEATYKGRKNRDRIDFEFEVKRASFLGFVNYGSPITTPAKGFLGRTIDVVVTENRIELPLFDSKNVSAKVSLKSGQYLAVGGLSADAQPALEKLTTQQKEGIEGGQNLFVLIRVDLHE